jgi:hypothetical protein
MNYEDIEDLNHIQGVHNNVFDWNDSQGSTYGIKSLGFRTSSPNKEADDLGLHKDGRSCRGVNPAFRPVDNSKRRGIKALPKRLKRLSIRYNSGS